MNRRISIGALVVLTLLLLATGCGKRTGSDAIKLEDGVLTWNEVKGASSYEVDLGNGGKRVDKTSYDLTSAFEHDGEFSVAVRYVDEKGERQEIGTIKVTASFMQQTIIGVEGSGDELFFSWSPVDGAASYSYDAHDGKGIQIAKTDEDGRYRIPITNLTEQMIRVVANGTSDGTTILLSTESVYTYKNGRVFDMSLLAKYPAVYTGDGTTQDIFKVGTTLKKGIYELEVSMFLMDSNGNRMIGNGIWGRRILDKGDQYFWFCDTEVEGFSNSGGTIPNSDEVYKVNMKLSVDRGGNVLIPVYDFNIGDRIVVADIQYKGQSILNKNGGTPNAVEEVEKLDVTNLDAYLAVFRSPGGYYVESPEQYQVEIPVNIKDGTHTVSVTYYVCDAAGGMLEGNGLWGRRIAGANAEGGPFVWLNEYDINSEYAAVDIPLPTQTKTSKFTVEVKGGRFTLSPIDFNKDELLIVTDVRTAKTPEGNGIFVSEGNISELFKVQTTLSGTPRYTDVTLSITYKVSDIFGNQVESNGTWGRRMDVGGELIWFCEQAVDRYPEAAGTIPKPNQEITKELHFSEINKLGVITINMYDFLAGDVVEITSIKYNGQEVLVK